MCDDDGLTFPFLSVECCDVIVGWNKIVDLKMCV